MASAQRAVADLIYHYWDPANVIPRIRPTADNGYVSNTAPYPTFWQMATMANVLYWQYKLTGAADLRAKILSQYAQVRSLYTEAQLSTADWSRNKHIINVSDDAAFAITYFVQVHDATGEPGALRIAKALIASTYRFFADRDRGGAGILYAVPGQDRDHQGVSQAIEALTARAALYVHQKTGEAAYLAYATGTWSWMRQYLKHPAGVYFCELDIRPTTMAARGQRDANPNYRRPVGYDRPGDIKRGGSVAYIGGTMAMGSLSAALYAQTGERRYLDEVNSIVAGMVRPDTFLRPGDAVGTPGPVFVNDRDAWSDGYFAPGFVADLLSLPPPAGGDASGTWQAALVNTALAIIRSRTPDGYYTPDWSGPEWDPSHRFETWVAQGSATTGQASSGGGMAKPDQMQTSATSVAMILAAALLERQGQRR